MKETIEILKLKKYAIFMIVLFFISVISLAVVFSNISYTDKTTSNKIEEINYEVINLNQTYQNLSNKKEYLMLNYLEIEKLYEELQTTYEQLNVNSSLTDENIILLQNKIAFYEAENKRLESEITTLEAQLK